MRKRLVNKGHAERNIDKQMSQRWCSHNLLDGNMLNLNRNGLDWLLGHILPRSLERQESVGHEVALDGERIEVFGKYITSRELPLHVAAIVIRLFFMLGVDDNTVAFRLDADFRRSEVPCIHADGKFVWHAGDRGFLLTERTGAAG